MEHFDAPGTSTEKRDPNLKKEIQSGPEVFKHYFDMGDRRKVDMDLFVERGIYSAEEVAHDNERVAKLEASPDYEKPTKASIVLENIFDDLSEKDNWFFDSSGENEYYTFLLSRFDDKMADSSRGDMALEIRMPDGEVINLLIDITTSRDYKKLGDKRRKCLEQIKKGNLHPVKYFHSQLTDEMRRESDIPMVIAGIDESSLEKFCERVGKYKSLSNDIVVFMLFDEIVEQLNEFSAASIETNGADHAVTKKLLKTRDFFTDMLKKKNSLRPKGFREKADSDRTYSNIMKP